MNRATWARAENGVLLNLHLYARLERSFGWAPGAVDDYLSGRSDLPHNTTDPTTPEGALEVRSLDGLPEVFRAEFVTYGVTDPIEQARFLQELALQFLTDQQSGPRDPEGT